MDRKKLLKGVIDIHVHAGPSVAARELDLSLIHILYRRSNPQIIRPAKDWPAARESPSSRKGSTCTPPRPGWGLTRMALMVLYAETVKAAAVWTLSLIHI